MSIDHDLPEVDETGSNWLDDMLRIDAQRDHHAIGDAAFAFAVMQSLPEQRGYDYGEVARLGLSALATTLAGLIVIDNGAALLGNFAHAMSTLAADQMIISVAPFGMLLGLALFTLRLQTTNR